MSKQEKDEFRKLLKERQQELEIFRNAQKENAAQSYKLANQAYRSLNKKDNPVKACAEATKSGIHIQSKIAMDGLKILMTIDEHTIQLNMLLENMSQDEDSNDDQD